MEDRNYFLKRFFPILVSWAVLSGLFSVFFIIAKADFESPSIEKMFLLIWILELAVAAAIGFFADGGFKLLFGINMLFGINIEHKDALVINSFVLNSHIDPKISDENLKSLFYQLKVEGRTAFKKAFMYSFLVTIINVLIMSFVGTSTSNKLIILGGGFFGIIIFSLFSFFSADKFLRGLLKECRKLMERRGTAPIKYMNPGNWNGG